MLEIKNVTKIYKSKGGVETKALDGVSITFGETGLVFLLGKSGSGKSTLLNVCGGLDEPTFGEVLVKGKSSKSFTGSDFDSYRNTFVGFIFQEYNVLDEFNVEDNVALALELQGKSKDKQKIHEILRDVELESFAKRKPNTLSGGQKQRIAIARALVKEPQIIMADEPTGALDSVTGKQVFDTLKRLSQTRLVIVVSHDREFAEVYGDRIVELKDGKIISDVTKTALPPRALDENVTVIGENTLSVKSGSSLNENNLKAIQDFVLSCDGDVIITRGKSNIAAFKKANRMTDDGATERFDATDESKLQLKSYDGREGKFIRSSLPARKAIRIGASGLKLKPVRLAFTILLSFIAFTMFGLFSTLMLYDGDKVAANSFAESDLEYFNLTKSYVTTVKETDYEWTQNTSVKFTDAELNDFSSKYGISSFGYYSGRYNFYPRNINVNMDKSNYYYTELTKFAFLPQAHPLRSAITGGYPQTANEICISRYLAEAMLSENSKVRAAQVNGSVVVYPEGFLEIERTEDVLGKYIGISVGDKEAAFKITGFFDDGGIPAKYDVLKEKSDNTLNYAYRAFLSEGLYQLVLVSDNFYDTYKKTGMFETEADKEKEKIDYFEYCSPSLSYFYDSGFFNGEEWVEGNIYSHWLTNKVKAFDAGGRKLKTLFLGESKTSLADDEAVVSIAELMNIAEKQIVKYFAEISESNEETALLIRQFGNLLDLYIDGFYYKEVETENGTTMERFEASYEERDAVLDEIQKVLINIQPVELLLKTDAAGNIPVKIAGFHALDLINDSDSYEGAYFSQKFIDANLKIYDDTGTTSKYHTNYVPEEGAVYRGLFVVYDGEKNTALSLLSCVGAENIKPNDVVYTLNSTLYESIQAANELAGLLSKVFLAVGLVFALFAALLMFNFISVSIANKRKEIGILRAVGARGTDVFKIFFAESGIIVGICTLLAVAGAAFGCRLLNAILKAEAGLEVTLFVFGIVSVLMMVCIAAFVAFISTFLPVYLAARKKPVDSIRAL